jgi:hypothetical protein
MTVFDLIFIGVFFATVILLVATAVAAIRGQRRRALGLLRGQGVFITVYLVVVIVASLVSPRRMILLNEPQCFDDWCVSVDHVDQTPAGTNILCAVTLRLYSRARGRAQREDGVSVYVLDDRGRRYEPQEDPQAVPFNVLVNPADSVIAIRRFLVPADTHNLGLVIAHGRFPGMFIIGDDQSLFHKPSVIRFPQVSNGSLTE